MTSGIAGTILIIAATISTGMMMKESHIKEL